MLERALAAEEAFGQRILSGEADPKALAVWQVLRPDRVMPVSANADVSRITIVPGQRSGQPCIRNLRVTVWDILDMLAAGLTEDDILADYPYLEKADFPAVYADASQAGRERIPR